VIDVVFLDIDGVLTDGAVYIDAAGNETKRILFDDIDAIFAMKREGIKIGFITGENNDFCKYIYRRLEPDFFSTGCKNKLSEAKKIIKEAGLDVKRMCYVGDSRKDIELLNFVKYSFVPQDADERVQSSAMHVLQSARGKGVIREVADFVISKNMSSQPK